MPTVKASKMLMKALYAEQDKRRARAIRIGATLEKYEVASEDEEYLSLCRAEEIAWEEAAVVTSVIRGLQELGFVPDA